MEVTKGVKNQANNESNDLYRLVDLKGNGHLVKLMKNARWSKNYTPVNEALETDVLPFLIKKGEGEEVSITDLVKARNEEAGRPKPKNKTPGNQKESYIPKKPVKRTRTVCWDRKKRGTVGESILHLCLLNSTIVHAELAKRLINRFPKLVNDIYLGDEYYGESALHMAITNEDPGMVRFLLNKDADCHERCCGNFFCPDDQKDSRTDSLEHEWVDVCENTNYEGHVYLGEYPLSFAACLGQEECVRLLLQKEVEVNRQDANGNTVMHMLVIHSNKDNPKLLDIFDLLHSKGAKLDIKNRQGLTPLTLAAKLPRKKIYEHILEKERTVHWTFGKTMCASYPLKEIDTISSDGEINKNSALNLIVYGEKAEHLDMMVGLVVNLLEDKWKHFVKKSFYKRFVVFVVYFICFFTSFILRPAKDICVGLNDTQSNEGCNTENETADPCYLLKAYQTEDKARLGLEVAVLTGAIIYICLAMKNIFRQGIWIFLTTMKAAPAAFLFLFSCFMVVFMLPGRAFCFSQYEDVVGVLAILSTAPYFLFFCRGVPKIGPFVVMIYKMIKGDLLRFFIIYAIFVIGFSQAMYIVFRDNEKSAFKYADQSILNMFVMSLGQFADFYDSFSGTKHPVMGKVVFVIYMIMVTLLLVNMLIAMMGNTYQLVNQQQKEWFRQWANIILVIEQNFSKEDRKKMLIKYSEPIKNEENRALNIRHHESIEGKETLKTN